MVSNESIYDLVEVEDSSKLTSKAGPRYVSIHHSSAVSAGKRDLRSTGSMGTLSQRRDPQQYLKKGRGNIRADERAMASRKVAASVSTVPQTLKEALPSRHAAPPIISASKKDFITQNAMDAILSQKKGMKPGEPAYRNKKDFGNVPQYLQKRNEQNVINEQERNNYLRRQKEAVQQRTRRLGDEEKQKLLDGLKQEWERVNREFQNLPLALDEMHKRREEKLVARLAALEKDLKLMSRDHIFVTS